MESKRNSKLSKKISQEQSVQSEESNSDENEKTQQRVESVKEPEEETKKEETNKCKITPCCISGACIIGVAICFFILFNLYQDFMSLDAELAEPESIQVMVKMIGVSLVLVLLGVARGVILGKCN